LETIKLLFSRRFFGLFLTQFMGAFNDNLFKNSVALMIAFKAAKTEAEAGIWVPLAGALFIFPFVLFSPVAGQISDRFDKARVMRWVKLAEIPIMCLGGIGFYMDSNPVLVFTIFLMGTQSAFFGPAKYSIIPQHLDQGELTTGNGLISMSTFVAILLGLIVATILVSQEALGNIIFGIVGCAILGAMFSRKIPPAPPCGDTGKISFDFFAQCKSLWKTTSANRTVHLTIFAISWLWFIGAVILTQIPLIAKFVLGGTADFSTTLTMFFVAGIALGALVCIKVSRGEIELGLIPIGAMGMSIFGIHFSYLDFSLAQLGTQTIFDYFLNPAHPVQAWILVDLLGVGFSASFFIIPLNALLQSRSDAKVRSQVMSANGIMNAIFMVVSAVGTMIMYGQGLLTTEILAVFFIMNIVVTFYIFALLPEFVLRLGFWLLSFFIYKIKYDNADSIPKRGGALIIANHISFVDWFVLTAACRRPVRYVMDHKIFNTPVLGLIFKLGRAIPIASAKEDGACKNKAFETISAALADGDIVAIFPEGAISRDGHMASFRPGVLNILKKNPVPVIPVGINGLWGSFFSYKSGRLMDGAPKLKIRGRVVGVDIGAQLDSKSSLEEMEAAVRSLIR
jgi:1-acyl-sn-glycerol-3-phosphate acyltransferase